MGPEIDDAHLDLGRDDAKARSLFSNLLREKPSTGRLALQQIARIKGLCEQHGGIVELIDEPGEKKISIRVGDQFNDEIRITDGIDPEEANLATRPARALAKIDPRFHEVIRLVSHLKMNCLAESMLRDSKGRTV